MSRLPNLTLVSLDTTLAEQALQLAAQQGLRGADAVYAAVALKTGYTLVSLDKEHLTGSRDVIKEADFWDSHDITDYLDEVEVVSGAYRPKEGETERNIVEETTRAGRTTINKKANG